MRKYLSGIGLLIFGYSLSVSGQSLILKQTNPDGIYKKGEKIQVFLENTECVSDSITVVIQRNFQQKTQKKLMTIVGSTLIFEEIIKEPATVVFEVVSENESASIGLIVDPEGFIPGTKRPKDFLQFWEQEKKALQALPMEVDSSSVKMDDPGYVCFDMSINCTEPKPARGYFAKPITAQAKSLPIVIFFHAAGVNGDWCRSKPGIALRYASMGKGALAFDLNAHGMLNGQPDEYYNHLDSTELKNYAQKGLESKNEIYFRGMYLRLLRTIDFLTRQPEWDGKRILVIGESQGGGQALAAAGLDKRVSAVVATVPAMCDWGATLVGHKGCWPYPFLTLNNKEKMLKVLPYFDVAHILKNSKATLVVEIGLIDQTCPSSAISSAINQSKGKKILYNVPYRGHHMTQPVFKEVFESTVVEPKHDFITDYLK